MTSILSFTEFCTALARRFHLQPTLMSCDASLLEDLSLDSIHMIEVVNCIADWGSPIRDDAAWRVRTLGDLYEYYRSGIERLTEEDS